MQFKENNTSNELPSTSDTISLKSKIQTKRPSSPLAPMTETYQHLHCPDSNNHHKLPTRVQNCEEQKPKKKIPK